uniref:Uncharacterized protein n=1 Tax=Micrurus corallinus TaxID=54390 RepID=A0A2D4H3P0_MICCO
MAGDLPHGLLRQSVSGSVDREPPQPPAPEGGQDQRDEPGQVRAPTWERSPEELLLPAGDGGGGGALKPGTAVGSSSWSQAECGGAATAIGANFGAQKTLG